MALKPRCEGVERAAAQLVARYQAEFVLLTAVSVPQHVVLAANRTSGPSRHSWRGGWPKNPWGRLSKCYAEQGVGAEVKVAIGNPAESVVTEAAASAADLVVMGRRGRVEPKDLVLGSVTDRVARDVAVPILLIP